MLPKMSGISLDLCQLAVTREKTVQGKGNFVAMMCCETCREKSSVRTNMWCAVYTKYGTERQISVQHGTFMAQFLFPFPQTARNGERHSPQFLFFLAVLFVFFAIFVRRGENYINGTAGISRDGTERVRRERRTERGKAGRNEASQPRISPITVPFRFFLVLMQLLNFVKKEQQLGYQNATEINSSGVRAEWKMTK